jgi:hypothetical protein
LLLLYALLALVAFAIFPANAVAQGGSVLYNGIQLPQTWPPLASPTQTYSLPSYISNPPAVIPIDVGRQLFVDDFLIQQTTMTRTQHRPVLYPWNPILAPGAEDTAGFAMPFSDGVWFDPADNLFKMWFYCGPGNTTCYAYSSDGKSWTRPSIPDAAVPNSDQVLVAAPGQAGITGLIIWMDLQDPDPTRKFKAFASDGTVPAYLYFSADGIHWTPNIRALYPIPMWDRTTYFWNPFRDVWVDSLKTYSTLPSASTRPSYQTRARDYSESTNLSAWTPAQPQDAGNYWTGPDANDPPYLPGGSYPQLYNLDAVAYESVMVGLFSWFYPGPNDTDPGNLPGPDLVELGVGFSRDGFQWVRPTRGSGPGTNGAFIPASNVAGTWNMGNTQSAGGGFLIVGDQLWFYVSGQNNLHAQVAQGSTGLATLRRDGFYSMDAGATPATLTTRPLEFSGKYFFVNVTDPQGSLTVQVLNPSNGAVLATSVPVSVDKTLQAVQWQNGLADLSSFSGQPVQFQFTLTNGELYSFWVSGSTSGASNGYVAANGPGFTGPVDNLGIGAYPTTVATPEIYPAGGVVSSSSSITISTRTLGATINYTIDGSVPTTSSPLYTGPIQLAANATVNAIASEPGLNNSAVAAATFTVDNTSPIVSVTAPASGQIVAAGISLTANATDNSAVGSVQFTVDGAPVGTVTSPPYAVPLETTTLTNGSHQVTATATDIVGNAATSAPVTFIVNNVSTGPTNGLAGYWSFDSAYLSGLTIFDQSGYGGDMTSNATNSVTGQLGQALLFDGSSSYANVATTASTQRYDLVGDLSLSLWVKTTNSTRDEALISRYSASGSGSGYLLRTNPAGTVELLLGVANVAGGSSLATDVTRINDGNWHHVAVVIHLGTTVTFYVDGALSSNVAINSTAATADSFFQLGVNSWVPYGNYFTGTMDEVRIYDRALSASDVASLYLSVSVTPPVATLSPGLSQSFLATVQNATNQSVNWSVTPSVGSVSSSGVYTPPATFTVSQTVTITATTVAAPYGSGTATVNLVAPISVSVSPTSGGTLYQGQTEAFTATVLNTPNLAVTWTINPSVGSVSAAGVYTAPASVPSSQVVTVTATSVADPTKSASAAITLSPPVSVSVAPTSGGMLYQGQTEGFTATVLNTPNLAVNWTINPNVGSVSAAGVYTAPASVTSSQVVTVTATSVADPTKSASASITLSPPVSVSVAPTSGGTLYQGQTEGFTATVLNTPNLAVNWTINPNVGSVSAAGVYTAPASVTSSQVVTVTATSVADPTKSASASITLSPPASVSVAPTSGGMLYQGQTEGFTATVLNTPNLVVNWTINPNVGSVSSSGVYTAPAVVSGSQVITVTATSVADPTKSGSATLTVAVASSSSADYVTSKSLGTMRNNYTGYVGMNITVGAAPITVTALGRIVAGSNGGSHIVKIVQALTGADVPGASASVNAGAGTPGTFAYATLSSPVTLSANTAYYVVTQETFGGDSWYDFNSSVQTTSAATATSAVYSSGSSYVTLGSAGQTYGPVDFVYSGTSAQPSITQQPQSQSVTAGATATFSVTATGGNLSYQWSSAPSGSSTFTTINGATGSSYTTPATTVAQSGTQYMCVVSNSAGPTASSAATLTVVVASLPTTNYITSFGLGTARNNFTGWVGMSITVGSSPVSVTALGRIVVAGNTGSHAVKIVNAATSQDVTGGSVSVPTSGGTAGTLAYANLPASVTLSANTTYYVVSQETQGGDAWYDVNTSIQTTAVAAENTGIYSYDGASYSGYGAANQSYGPIGFLYSTAAVQPEITQQPQSQTVTAGAVATFSVSASGGSLSYQWFSAPSGSSSFTAISGATASSYTTPATTLAQSGTQFMCAVSNGNGSVNSSAATLTVTAGASGTYFVTSESLGTLRNNYTGYVGMNITVGAAPITVTALGRIVTGSSGGSHIVKIVQASTGADVPGASVTVNVGTGTPGTFAYATLSSPVTLSANTAYYVVTQETFGGDSWYDYNSSVQTTSVATATSAVYSSGASYVALGGPGQAYGPVDFVYGGAGSQPSITQQPQGQSMTAGATATFSVTATGTGLSYQWSSAPSGSSTFTAISGATGSSYTTPATTVAQSGTQYMCAVSNGNGSVNSSAATLTVTEGASGTYFVTSESLGTLRNNYTGYVGMNITVGAAPITVTALGRIVAGSNGGSHVVKIVQASTGTDVPGASVTVNVGTGTPGTFAYATLSSPVMLSANTAYYVVTQETFGGDSWYDFNSYVQTTSAATATSAVYSISSSSYVTLGSPGQSYGPVDFKY